MSSPTLRTSRWLAQRLGLSLTTVERLRASAPSELPPCIVIGRSVRYAEATVEAWLAERQAAHGDGRTPATEGDPHVAA